MEATNSDNQNSVEKLSLQTHYNQIENPVSLVFKISNSRNFLQLSSKQHLQKFEGQNFSWLTSSYFKMLFFLVEPTREILNNLISSRTFLSNLHDSFKIPVKS